MLKVDRTFEAFNHGTGWPNGKPKACFIHATRSGQPNRKSLAGHAKEMTSTINWFLSPASRASTNLIISPVEIVRMVSDEDYGWHAVEHSDWAYSIEMTQALTTDPFLDGHYELLARTGRHYVSLGVPPVYLPHYSNGMEGFTGHEDSEQGVRSGKSDPGSLFDWDRFISMIQKPHQEDDMSFIGNGFDERYPLGNAKFESWRLFIGTGGLTRQKNKTKLDRTASAARLIPLSAEELDEYLVS